MTMAVALIGDLVASRSAPSRAHAQVQLLEALDTVNEQIASVQALEPTIGDEFQGVYHDPFQAVRASLRIRLALEHPMDARMGLGWGELHIVGASRYGLTQDGSAWWEARSAIDVVKEQEQRTPGVRTRIHQAADSGKGDPMIATLNAYLLSRDDVVSRFTARQRRIVAHLVAGRTQQQAAQNEGISASAVSQGLKRTGAAVVVTADRELPWP